MELYRKGKKHKYMSTTSTTTTATVVPLPNIATPADKMQLGKNTILTEKVFSKSEQIDEFIHLDIFTGSFLTGLALTVICIVYLFEEKTEYICWIFGIFLLVLLPITWVGDFISSSSSKYKFYVGICLFFGIILNFTAILMVVLYTNGVNNRIKELKSKEVVKQGQNPSNFHINPNISHNYQMIKIMFTTNLVLCITIIMNFFVYEGENKSGSGSTKESKMSNNMYWWYKLVHDTFIRIDQFIISILEYLPIHGFIKMFLLFCAGFLFFFFSFFVRLKTSWTNPQITSDSKDEYIRSQSEDYIQQLIKEFGYGLNGVYPKNDFDIVDFPNILVETAGPVDFAALSSFFLSVAFSVIIWFISLLIPKKSVKDGVKSSMGVIGQGIYNTPGVIGKGIYNTPGVISKGIYNTPGVISKGISNASSAIIGISKIPKFRGGNESNAIINYSLIGILISFCISLVVLIITYCGSAGFIFLVYTAVLLLTLIFGGNTFGISILLGILFTANFLFLYFGNLGSSKQDKSSNNKTSQNYILFCLCFLFSLLGTPVVFMVFELLGRIFGVSLAGDLKSYFFSKQPNPKTCKDDSMLDCQWRVVYSTVLLCASFLGLLFGIFSYGTSFGKSESQSTWMSSNGNNSQIKIFVITIMSIMVGWFFALHLKFNMFSFLYESVMQPARFVLFFFAPITVVGLAITQIVLASVSAKLIGTPVNTDG